MANSIGLFALVISFGSLKILDIMLARTVRLMSIIISLMLNMVTYILRLLWLQRVLVDVGCRQKWITDNCSVTLEDALRMWIW